MSKRHRPYVSVISWALVYYSQYRVEAYEPLHQNEPLHQSKLLHQKVGRCLRYVQTAYASDGPSPYPTPPGAPSKDQYF